MKANEIRVLCGEHRILINFVCPDSGKTKKIPVKKLKEELKEELKLKTRPTEDLGLILEMAICIALKIPYIGEFRYSLEKAEALAQKLCNLHQFITEPLTHTAQGKGKYDFTGETLRLSAKSNKKHHKVAPQTIGQPTKKRFCEEFGLRPELAEPSAIKEYILGHVRDMLPRYFVNTFDCSILYYHEKENTLEIIQAKQLNPIDWLDKNKKITFSKNTVDTWNEGSTLYLEVEPGITKAIGEFQLHNHRNGVKFRWDMRNLLNAFPDNFTVRLL